MTDINIKHAHPVDPECSQPYISAMFFANREVFRKFGCLLARPGNTSLEFKISTKLTHNMSGNDEAVTELSSTNINIE